MNFHPMRDSAHHVGFPDDGSGTRDLCTAAAVCRFIAPLREWGTRDAGTRDRDTLAAGGTTAGVGRRQRARGVSHWRFGWNAPSLFGGCAWQSDGNDHFRLWRAGRAVIAMHLDLAGEFDDLRAWKHARAPSLTNTLPSFAPMLFTWTLPFLSLAAAGF